MLYSAFPEDFPSRPWRGGGYEFLITLYTEAEILPKIEWKEGSGSKFAIFEIKLFECHHRGRQ